MPAAGALPDPTMATLLAAHPWPAQHACARRLEWLWTFDIAAPRMQVWPLIADMSRLNRALGNPEMQFEERDGQRYGRGRYGGVMHAWHEVPWNWAAGRFYALSRDYSQGAMRALYSIHAFDDLPDGGTRLTVYFGVVPRWGFITPALKLSFAAIGRAYRRLGPSLAERPRDAPRPPVFELQPDPLRPEAEARLRAIDVELRATPADPEMVKRLLDFVRTGDELELARIQIRERARVWQCDEHALLRAALFATRAGLFELAWDVVCPHCRGVRDSDAHLSAIGQQGRCDACDVTFGTADAIEITFRVHASLREFVARQYCSAEPARKPHILMQQAVAVDATVDIALELEPGRYRLRRRGVDGPDGLLEVETRHDARDIAWSTAAPVGEQLVAPRVTLRLANAGPQPTTFVVEEARPSDLALRPGRLLSHPDFRDLFSDEYLANDVGLSVGEQTILFTDIVGSTAMYLTGGDPGAFVAVRAHFTKVFAIVAAWRGAVIKTIGDAVMAAFTDPLDAVRAAEAIQLAFAGPDEPLRLRISLNTGPCIAVRLNANLDFFGNTVNLAAKLQAIAETGQVGLASTTLNAPGVRDHLASRNATLNAVPLSVKGLADPMAGWRWDVWT